MVQLVGVRYQLCQLCQTPLPLSSPKTMTDETNRVYFWELLTFLFVCGLVKEGLDMQKQD